MVDRICAVEGCNTSRRKRDWCGKHYQRWTKYGTPDHQVRQRISRDGDCSVAGCNRAIRISGMCDMHYQRVLKSGDAGEADPRHVFTDRERFERSVSKTETCWIWTGFIDKKGYGRVRRGAMAHRLSYELHVGPIPAGLELDHLCENRPCVNPAHLEPVTHEENVKRIHRRRAASA